MSSETVRNHLIQKDIKRANATSVDYIFSSCLYAARGLSTLMCGGGSKRKPRVITPSLFNPSDMATFLNEVSTESKVVVFVPDEPVAMLLTLRSLVRICRLSTWPLPAVIISRFHPDWLYQTLRSQVRNLDALSALRVVSANISLRGLNNMLSSESSPSLLVRQISKRGRGDEKVMIGITTRELETLLGTLMGLSIREQSELSGLNSKTLYTQRLSGSRKLIKQLPQLSWILPRHSFSPNGKVITSLLSHLSPQEVEFEQAVHRGQVFPVFQPIVDPYMNVQGFEILIRWFKKGKILMPGEFLPELKATQSWVLLTALVISEAVQQIMRFRGQYYFSVNVPAILIENGALMRMMKTAQHQLQDDALSDRLVLEFAETTDFFLAPAIDTIKQMTNSGHRVLLDDCFSRGSVMFPVRQIQFSGYKLDMSIVNTFIHNVHDANLVKSLVEYCRLTKGLCIAEGVDTADKFHELIKAGVSGLQGYYISQPVLREELDAILHSLGSKKLSYTGQKAQK
ncbi:EAL domain-containing protein [Rahnella variigena]|uniref:EAL domain-containing protein n=1 Tax=Rahnella variigena TaxID=574964 RepID=UPI0013305046|nr:EAL domain-containing protein [Rahnella variigena]